MQITNAIHDSIMQAISADGRRKFSSLGEVYFQNTGELVRLLTVKIRKKYGAAVIYADMSVLLASEFAEFSHKHGHTEPRPPSLTSALLMNFPEIMRCAYLENGLPSSGWLERASKLFAALPADVSTLESIFAGEFNALTTLERMPIFVHHMRTILKSE